MVTSRRLGLQLHGLATNNDPMSVSQMLRRTTAGLVTASLVGAASVAAGQVNLPDIGDSSETVFSSQLEREVGEYFMRQVRATVTLVSDPEIEDYLKSLGYRLASASGQ